MSTLNSTNMSVNRPTTKVRHAPGGASSISLSFDEQPVGAAKSGFKPTFDPSPELVEPVEVETAKPAPAPESVQSEAPAVAVEAAPAPEVVVAPSGVRVGLVFPSSSAVNEALKARTVEVLQARGVADISVVAVADVLQLPFAAKQLVARAKAGLDAVIVLAAITEEVWASSEIAAAVANGVVQLSLEQSVPVVPGFVYAVSEKEASFKVMDQPAGWVTSALSLAKFEVQTVAPKPAAPAAPVPPSPVKDPETPTKPVTTRPPGAVDGTPKGTPMRSSRGRGAGPSSIVFG